MKHSQLKKLIKEEISKTLEENIELNKKSGQLVGDINNALNRIKEVVDYPDFAAAVAHVLEDRYGTHLYERFINELKKHLSR